MWMVECNKNDHEAKDPNTSADRGRLQPLMPRPIISSSPTTKNAPFSTLPTSCYCCIQNPNILPWSHAMSGTASDYGITKTTPLVSTRWNPTPEQLQALEEMYRRGTRTPTAEQIQQIAAKLRRFGKIEGKNVFYWFQNHKARERQKKRRQMEMLAGKRMRQNNVENLDNNHARGLSRRYFEIDQHHKKLPTASNCGTPSEDSASMHGSVVPEYRKDGRTGFDQKELQQHKILTAKNETTCWQLDLLSTITAHKACGQENIAKPFRGPGHSELLPELHENIDRGIEDHRTLQLFPVKSDDSSNGNASEDEVVHGVSTRVGITKFKPNEFIEFLPTNI